MKNVVITLLHVCRITVTFKEVEYEFALKNEYSAMYLMVLFSFPSLSLSPLFLRYVEGLGTCSLEGRRDVEMGAFFSSPQPSVGDGSADLLGGLSSSREGVLHPVLHPVFLAGILRFGLLL